MSTTLTTRDLHDREIKVRLTDRDAAFLQQLAVRNGVPVAVLARMLIIRGLNQSVGAVEQVALGEGRAP